MFNYGIPVFVTLSEIEIVLCSCETLVLVIGGALCCCCGSRLLRLPWSLAQLWALLDVEVDCAYIIPSATRLMSHPEVPHWRWLGKCKHSPRRRTHRIAPSKVSKSGWSLALPETQDFLQPMRASSPTNVELRGVFLLRMSSSRRWKGLA